MPPAGSATNVPAPFVNEPKDLTSDARLAIRRKWRVALFFAAWTTFAAAAAWWLAHFDSSGTSNAPLVIDTGNASKMSVGQQIRVWLKLADLNFRGAYPWVLLAPYIVLLASFFPLERGRLRLSLPVHIIACSLFVVASIALLNRLEASGIGLVVVSNHAEGASFPTNEIPFKLGRDLPDLPTNMQAYHSNIVNVFESGGASGGQDTRVQISISTNGTAGFLRGEHLISGDAIELETNSGPGLRTMTKRVTAWSSSLQAGRRPFSLLLDLFAYGSLVGSAHAVHFYRRFREREQRALLLESHLASARLHALQAQLHPHFLFNALNAVATLIHHDADAALETLTSFSELLRLALSQSEKQEVPLREDLRFLQRYVEIQQVRLGGRFRFEQEVDPAALDCLVPALLLQVLVENALRHGIEPAAQPGVVRLVARLSGERLLLSVEDNGAGFRPGANANSGIGLSNLRARLKLLYADKQMLEIGNRPEGGVAVRIEIPVHAEAPARSIESTTQS
jgi:anti-sigma regulatory factor (Ser/Thr protein kinase)